MNAGRAPETFRIRAAEFAAQARFREARAGDQHPGHAGCTGPLDDCLAVMIELAIEQVDADVGKPFAHGMLASLTWSMGTGLPMRRP